MSNLRIGGLASGIDTHGIIEQMMQVERMPLDKMMQKKQVLEWQRDDYREINRKLQEFRLFLSDSFGKQATLNAKTVNSSNASRITATARADAADTSYVISQVTQLATAASNASSGENGIGKDGAKIDPNKKLSEVEFAGGFTAGEQFSITTYNKDGQAVTKSFTADGSKTLNEVMAEVNRSGIGVNMFYDEYSGKVSITRTETGKNNPNGPEMVLEGDFLENTLQFNEPETSAKNAVFTINGLETQRTSNTFTVNGTTITLHDTFTDSSAVTINVVKDVDKVVDSVKEFITKYNEMIDLINGKLTEERYRSYTPLSEEQKYGMKDKEIEMWEEKARSGLLRNDPVLSSGLSQIRMALAESIKGLESQLGIKSLADIGIVTTKNYMDGGKLELDTSQKGADRLTGEERLRKAIAEDPDAFYNIFMGGTSDGPQAEQGVARRMIGLIDKTIKENIEQRAGNEFRQNHQFTIGRELDDVNKRISNFEQRLKQIEDRLWKKFSAMENSLSALNSQSEALMSQMMSLSGMNKR